MSELEAAETFELRIDDEVYRSVAENCVGRIPGIWTPSAIARLSRASRSGVSGPEVRVHVSDGGPIQVDLTVDLDDAVPIPSIAASLQKEVKSVIQEMTGTEVSRVDVTVRRLWSSNEVEPAAPLPLGSGRGENESEN